MTLGARTLKILVTGVNGFTGRFFQVAAKNAAHEVIALQANLKDKTAVAAEVAAAQPDAVVHLAAISFVGHADEAAFYAVNVVGTTNLLTALTTLQKTPKKVLLASSANVYGNCVASPIGEEHPPAPVNHYAMSKLAMEFMARTYLDHLPIVLARPFNYTGAGQALNFIIPKLVDHYARRASVVELGNLHVEREFNDVRMVCEAYLALLESGEPGEVYNVCSGQPYTLKQVMHTLNELTGHTLQAISNPAFMRANELLRLCGDPSKLNNLLNRSGRARINYSLRQTLALMLAQA